MSDVGLQSRVVHLLSVASNIRRYEEALSHARGERFNVFDILHVGHYEVRTHSPMLAEILNPKGSHGQGAVFLQLFLAELKILDFEAESARVATEVSIGHLGRVDIEITDRNGQRVVIENKIYAGLQEKQLERYRQKYPKAHLLYLTLKGETLADGTDQKIVPISYQINIVRWLECCRKEVATVPSVREAITQYIHLIQRLTQQNTNTHMNRELIEAVLKDKDTYLAYANLRNANGDILKQIAVKVNAQLEAIGLELGLKMREKFAAKGEAYEGCFFTTPDMEAQNLQFGFQCQSSGYRNFCFGFAYIKRELNSALKSQIEKAFKTAFTVFDSSPDWPACPWCVQHRTWDDETIAAILSPDGEFAKDLKALIGKMAEVAAEASQASAVASQQS